MSDAEIIFEEMVWKATPVEKSLEEIATEAFVESDPQKLVNLAISCFKTNVFPGDRALNRQRVLKYAQKAFNQAFTRGTLREVRAYHLLSLDDTVGLIKKSMKRGAFHTERFNYELILSNTVTSFAVLALLSGGDEEKFRATEDELPYSDEL